MPESKRRRVLEGRVEVKMSRKEDWIELVKKN